MSLDKVYAEIDERTKEFIDKLREAVEIPSISAEAEHRHDVFRMIDWAENQLAALGAKCEQIPNGEETLPDGKKIPLPPVLFATLGADKSKKTLLVYGHLDVQPAAKADGWDTEPFELVERDGKLMGRGSSDDKGPVIAWSTCVKRVLQSQAVEIPVNIKFVLEGMEESQSLGLDDILREHQSTFLADVDATCISDNYWLGKRKPCITYGLRGICYYHIEISMSRQDLHSGLYGGTLHEPMTSLVHLMSTLSGIDGKIKIDGLDKLIAPLTDAEQATYKDIDFCIDEFKADIGVKKLVSDSPQQILMNRWRYPSLSLHGIEGAFSSPGGKTVIPSKVIGKFSIRLVPNMDTHTVDKLVNDHLQKAWSALGSPCYFKVHAGGGGHPWLSDIGHPHYQAAARALEKVFKVKPDYIREGGSIPVTLTFQELTNKNVLLLPIGSCDDMAHSQNEKINISNYIMGTKALATYLLELAQL